MLDVVAYLIGAVLLVLAPEIQKYVKEKYRRFVKRLEKNRAYEKEINDILIAMLHRFECQRIMVFQYFNGIKNVLGQPAEFLSSVYEVADSNTIKIAPDFKMTPTTTWKTEISRIEKHNGVLMQDINTAEEGMKYYMKMYNSERNYQLKIDENDLGQGLITIDFSSSAKQLDEEEIDYLNRARRSINELMKKIK